MPDRREHDANRNPYRSRSTANPSEDIGLYPTAGLIPAHYVVRISSRTNPSSATRLIVESRPFYSRSEADSWRDFVQSQHKRDSVFVIEVPHPCET
jgi:hypothetical protein